MAGCCQAARPLRSLATPRCFAARKVRFVGRAGGRSLHIKAACRGANAADASPSTDAAEAKGSPEGTDASASGERHALDKQVLELALPALVALCAEPALSIIDTGFVGRLQDPAVSLAGLGVATSVFDFIFRCYNFLCVVVVPLVAKSVVAKRVGDPSAEEPAQITGRVVGLAACLGLATWLGLAWAAAPALQLAGADPASPLGAAAEAYLRVRAAALPASLVNTVAVGAFRGHLDTATPLRVILGQTLANVVLGAILVFGVDAIGIPSLGVEGAAWATAISVWVSCGTFCLILTRRGLIAWEAAATWPLALPEMQPLIVGGLAQLLRTLALQAVLLQFTRTVLGLDISGLAAAAHQVALRTWFFALFALDSIAVAAQALLPTALADGGVAGARPVALRLLQWGAAAGVLSGVALAAGAATIPAIFTDAADVQAAARPLIVLIALLQPLAGLVFTWDGVFQGLSDYSYLAVAMAASAVVTTAALQLDVLHGSLEGVWACFALFLLCRALGLAWRFWGMGPLGDARQ